MRTFEMTTVWKLDANRWLFNSQDTTDVTVSLHDFTNTFLNEATIEEPLDAHPLLPPRLNTSSETEDTQEQSTQQQSQPPTAVESNITTSPEVASYGMLDIARFTGNDGAAGLAQNITFADWATRTLFRQSVLRNDSAKCMLPVVESLLMLPGQRVLRAPCRVRNCARNARTCTQSHTHTLQTRTHKNTQAPLFSQMDITGFLKVNASYCMHSSSYLMNHGTPLPICRTQTLRCVYVGLCVLTFCLVSVCPLNITGAQPYTQPVEMSTSETAVLQCIYTHSPTESFLFNNYHIRHVACIHYVFCCARANWLL